MFFLTPCLSSVLWLLPAGHAVLDRPPSALTQNRVGDETIVIIRGEPQLFQTPTKGSTKGQWLPHKDALCACFTYDQKAIVIADANGLTLYSKDQLKSLVRYDLPVSVPVAILPNARGVFVIGHRGAIWSIEDTEKTITKLRAGDDECDNATLSPDGKHVALALRSGEVVVFAIRPFKELGRINPGVGRRAGECAVAFSPKGDLLAVGGTDSKLSVRKLEKLSDEVAAIQTAGPILCVNFVAQDSIVAGDRSGNLYLYNHRTRQSYSRKIYKLELHSVWYSPSSCVLATVGEDKSLLLWRSGYFEHYPMK